MTHSKRLLYVPFLVSTLSLALLLPSCGGDEAANPHERLANKEFAAAAAAFEASLATLKPTDALWLQAKKGHIQALAGSGDKRAIELAKELLKTHSAALGEQGVSKFAQQLKESKGWDAAMAMLEATVATWPDSALLDSSYSNVVNDYAAKVHTTDAADKLKGLGYTGGDKQAPVPRPGSKTVVKSKE